jgi:hypothetical protein
LHKTRTTTLRLPSCRKWRKSFQLVGDS